MSKNKNKAEIKAPTKRAKKEARTKVEMKTDALDSKRGQIKRKSERLIKIVAEVTEVKRELRDLEIEYWEIETDRESLAL
jgi:F420-dependent methylenetetrahydromethanopterin dehydrogenase